MLSSDMYGMLTTLTYCRILESMRLTYRERIIG